MTTAAFVGKVYLERGDTGSPISYTRICQVTNISGLGQTNDLVEATNFCSGGAKEYISGLADGAEVTITANFETGAQVLRDMIDDVKTKTTRAFRVIADDELSPGVHFYFNATCLSWQLSPSTSDKNAIDFTVKISGDITVAVETA